MANILNRQHYHKGDWIFRTGDGATSAFLIQAGSVDIIIGRVTLKRSSARSAPVRSLARWRCLTTRPDQRPRLHVNPRPASSLPVPTSRSGLINPTRLSARSSC